MFNTSTICPSYSYCWCHYHYTGGSFVDEDNLYTIGLDVTCTCTYWCELYPFYTNCLL